MCEHSIPSSQPTELAELSARSLTQANPFRSGPLVLNLTDVSVNGRTVPIKTVSGFEVQNLVIRGGARARGITVGPFVAPHGLRMQFRLAQPVKL
ncbi:MAG: hypothetical protein DMF11_13760 [Verrucomicrobia bacterium]|nr:MAG: hypothetical protein DMF11_13760 [Verrucomicrobiota bacterium]